jgi:nicotinate phosphoribosyltransferase
MRSLLDNDLYKFTMQEAIMHHFPRSTVRYSFINRGHTEFPEDFDSELKMDISSWIQHRLGERSKHYLLKNCRFLSPAYLDFLSGYEFNPHEVKITQTGPDLEIIIEGPWYRTVLWEVPLLAAISELYYKMAPNVVTFPTDALTKINQAKRVTILKHGLAVADFGTRRRFSYANQEKIVIDLGKALTGTSNVYLATEKCITPIGTHAHECHAHEWFMYHAVKYGYAAANYMALKNWVRTFKGDLGIALTDTYTSDIFFQSFNTMHSKLFDGVRHDSGDITPFIRKTIKHYKSHGIDPSTKTIVFSDGLNVDDAVLIKGWCDQAGIRAAFGIGTSLTNDVGVEPLNIVIKLSHVLGRDKSWLPAVKLSDTPGKNTGDSREVTLCKEVLRCD